MTKYGEEDLEILSDPGNRTPLQGMRRRSPVVAFLTAVLRLVVPVAFLLGTFVLAQYAQNHPVTVFDRYPSDQAERNLSAWLNAGHFVIPLTFFVIHLTNRAYGAGIAFGQVVVAWAILAVGTVHFLPEITGLISWWETPEQAPAFAASLLAGHLVAVIVFDMTRGPNWWKAPFYAGLFGSAVYVGLSWALMPAASSVAPAAEAAINFAMAILLLLPYWILRPLIRPLPGYGGA
ncbi:MAG: hypothetical protein ACLFWF_08325 [Alphaproteobacteria bacterium]